MQAPTDLPGFARVRGLLRDGDAVGALLAIAESRPDARPLNVLGRVHDERATAFLQRLRLQRHLGRYWDATAALAISGDAAARAEYLSLMGDDRSLTDMLLERLDSNCCLGFAAHRWLRAIYPTIPFDDGYGGAGTAATRAWLEQFDWKRSPLMEGGVPVHK